VGKVALSNLQFFAVHHILNLNPGEEKMSFRIFLGSIGSKHLPQYGIPNRVQIDASIGLSHIEQIG